MGGLDIFNSVLSQLCPVLDSRTAPGSLVVEALKNGHLGLKSGNGVYNWPPETIAARRSAREQSLIAFMKQDQAEKA